MSPFFHEHADSVVVRLSSYPFPPARHLRDFHLTNHALLWKDRSITSLFRCIDIIFQSLHMFKGSVCGLLFDTDFAYQHHF